MNLSFKIHRRIQNLYTQSIHAELQGNDDIAFFGYIKSLEVLVKDIAIIEHPDSEDMVLFSSLIQCLEKFHSTNIHLFSKKLLEVLKNDYLHYQKGPEFSSYTELVKDCIDYFLLYLELLQKTFSLNDKRTEKSLKIGNCSYPLFAYSFIHLEMLEIKLIKEDINAKNCYLSVLINLPTHYINMK